LNNPAQRLLDILKEGKSTEINSNATCLEVWKRLLKVTGNDDAQLLSRLGKTIALVGEIEDEVKQIENVDPASLLAWVPLLRNAFASQNLAGAWSGFISKIDVHTLNYLSNCSALLDSNFKEKYKPIESLDELANEIEIILHEVLNSDLPEVVKSFMSLKLREIQRAIDEFHITGNGPIVKAVESYYGHLILHKEKIKSYKDHPIFKKFGSLMNGLAIVITVTMGALQLPDEVKEYFPGDTVIELPKELNDNGDPDENEETDEGTIVT